MHSAAEAARCWTRSEQSPRADQPQLQEEDAQRDLRVLESSLSEREDFSPFAVRCESHDDDVDGFEHLAPILSSWAGKSWSFTFNEGGLIVFM